ncbi:GNAT family N-acetyltransferase [Ectothiorhodospira lacustris]|uniref:GNAT family N-acetyltransferase n=1 Tax=Ectothiorhodospira lacustris TaxID=2899127 RepID=UPI003D31D98D
MQTADTPAADDWNVPRPGLSVSLATCDDDVLASQRLRYQIFAREMGATLPAAAALLGLDHDRYDRYCHHLLVRDGHTGAVVAYTRILKDTEARLAGGFYSQNEFELDGLDRLPGRIMEIGRTCVHPDYRSGTAIAVLWSGLGRFMATHRIRYLIGCASIGLHDGGHQAHAIMERLKGRHPDPETLLVRSRLPLPRQVAGCEGAVIMPPLLKAYLRLGARIGAEPCWDPDFNVADVFIFLDEGLVPARYRRHFLRTPLSADCHESHQMHL